MKIQYAVVSTVGMVRAVNEDNFYANGTIKTMTRANATIRNKVALDTGLYAVCDGLGGEGYGEQASFIAVNTLKSFQNSFQKDCIEYIKQANGQILNEQRLKSTNMGCTIAALCVAQEQIMVMNMGDSRIYQCTQNELKVLSEEHSEFAVMMKYGLLTEADYYSHPSRNRLTRVLGMENVEELQPYVLEDIAWNDGDLFLLCSDGFCAWVLPNEIESLLRGADSLLSKCKKMIKSALKHGGDDNITVMLLRVEG